ncbi:T9SS type A sorting domain-containing protein [Bacteroidota bacterium]
MLVHQKIIRNTFILIISAIAVFNNYSQAAYYDENETVESTVNKSKSDEPPFIIHYGLNDSHSRSWVQKNREGITGITYFKRFAGSTDEGTLIYKSILPDGSENMDPIIDGRRLEKSVLLYDSLAKPHIFVARSDTVDQVIDHYFKDDNNHWQSEIIIHFYNEGGKFIYELSADKGPDHSFHLLILKTRSDVDSDDFMDAWINSHLYHLTNSTGIWENELIYNYDMAYTYDMCMKSSIRQDIEIDSEGYVHITFSEQLNGSYDPSRLWYATNRSGSWEREIALNYNPGAVDDAGWFPSLCLDNDDTPHIACNYLKRVPTHSVTSCKLLLLKRIGYNEWDSEVIAEQDDGYYGGDGRNYTGALCHLKFDSYNIPHIVFSDIAATHWDYQRMNVGNIRYGVFSEGNWYIRTIYRQPLPTGFFDATEMSGMCLINLEEIETIRIIGQELVITGENQYTSNEVGFVLDDTNNIKDDNFINHFELKQNYPNPFNSTTIIKYSVPQRSIISLKVYDVLGNWVTTLFDGENSPGNYEISFNADGLPSGIYFYQLKSISYIETKKLLLIK